MKKTLASSIFLILLTIQNDSIFLVTNAAGLTLNDGFITTRGVHFMYNGSPYYANGFNAYWLMLLASDPSQRHKVSSAFQEASSHGLSVARTWAFSDGGDTPLQYSPGSYNEKMFQGLDFVLAEARRYKIKLILSLVNNYENLGGKEQYVNWARNQGQYLTSDDDFFTNPVTKEFYKNHVKTVLTRYNTVTGVMYKNDPTIMAWELMNEPRCTSDTSGRTIQAWITEMAAYVKSIDGNHLLEAGLEGFYGKSNSLNPGFDIGTDFISNNQISDIDFATLHSYPDQWLTSYDDQTQLSFLNSWLRTHIRDAQNILKKPLLITEFGKSVEDPKSSTYERDQLFNLVYNNVYLSALHGGAAAGCLFWQLLAEGMESFGDGYDIVLSQGSSTANLIGSQGRRLFQIWKIFESMRNVQR